MPVVDAGGRGMDTGIWEEIRGKLGIARAGKPMLIGMAVVLVLVAAATVHVLSGAATASDFEVSHGASASASAEASDVAAPRTLFVHVSGSVAKPGLYELEQGSRVADAVNAAGGFADDAAEDSCNLARILEDGEHIIVARRGEDAAGTDAGGQAQATGTATGLVNINMASADQLESLPGIGAATAQKIVADRAANGPFKTVDDLMRVSGIGEKKLASLTGLICV